jgi:hypothetical protein
MKPGDKVPFENGVATVVMTHMIVNHFVDNKFSYASTDGVLLKVEGVSPACLAKLSDSGELVATVPNWKELG